MLNAFICWFFLGNGTFEKEKIGFYSSKRIDVVVDNLDSCEMVSLLTDENNSTNTE